MRRRRSARAALPVQAPPPNDRGREGFRLPALRTARAVFPHTALQSVVSSSGVSRCLPGRVKGEQPGIREVGVGPAYLIGPGESETGPLFLLAQDGAQPPAYELVQALEGVAAGVLEVAKPTSQYRVQSVDDPRQALPARPSRLLPDLAFETGEALLADIASAAGEAVAKELEALCRSPTVDDVGLVRMQAKAVLRHPFLDRRERGLGLFLAPAENHEVVRIAHHAIAVGCHLRIQRGQVDVGQQRDRKSTRLNSSHVAISYAYFC